jgi:ketosteroid isomerase-like protein
MRKLTILIILVTAAAVVLAQEPAKPAAAQSDAQKTAANNIIGLEQQFWEALKNKDVKFLDANVPDDLVTVSMFGVLGKAAVIDVFSKMPCEVKAVTLTDFKVTFFNSETAFVTFKGTTDGTCADRAVPTVWASAVYVKRHDRWLKVSHQETRAL